MPFLRYKEAPAVVLLCPPADPFFLLPNILKIFKYSYTCIYFMIGELNQLSRTMVYGIYINFQTLSGILILVSSWQPAASKEENILIP